MGGNSCIPQFAALLLLCADERQFNLIPVELYSLGILPDKAEEIPHLLSIEVCLQLQKYLARNPYV